MAQYFMCETEFSWYVSIVYVIQYGYMTIYSFFSYIFFFLFLNVSLAINAGNEERLSQRYD